MKAITSVPPRELNAEFDVSFSGEQATITIHSRGGSRARGQINPDYEVLVQTLLERLKESGAFLSEVLLASRTVASLPRVQRRIEVEQFELPVDLNDVDDVTELRLAIRRAVVRSHSTSSNATHGNATKKIELAAACGLLPDELIHSLISGDIHSIEIDEASSRAFREGRRVLQVHYRRERNQSLVREAKSQFKSKHGSLFCEVCKFDFSRVYGELGDGVIEAHHEEPLAGSEGETLTRIEDLRMVCANCHRMLHRINENGMLTSANELRLIIAKPEEL